MDGFSHQRDVRDVEPTGFAKLDPRLMNPAKAAQAQRFESDLRRAEDSLINPGPISLLIERNGCTNEQLGDLVTRLTIALDGIAGPSAENEVLWGGGNANSTGRPGDYVGALAELSIHADIRQQLLHRLNGLVSRVEALR